MSELSKYEWYEQGYARLGFMFGSVSGTNIEKFVYYKAVMYTMKKYKVNKSTAVQAVAEDLGPSISTVWRAVYFFEKD